MPRKAIRAPRASNLAYRTLQPGSDSAPCPSRCFAIGSRVPVSGLSCRCPPRSDTALCQARDAGASLVQRTRSPSSDPCRNLGEPCGRNRLRAARAAGGHHAVSRQGSMSIRVFVPESRNRYAYCQHHQANPRASDLMRHSRPRDSLEKSIRVSMAAQSRPVGGTSHLRPASTPVARARIPIVVQSVAARRADHATIRCSP